MVDEKGHLIALRMTDSSGKTCPLALEVPDFSAGQTPDSGETPYRIVGIAAWLPGYEPIEVTGVQIFPDITTTQELVMIPLEELGSLGEMSEDFDTPPQNL